ncbi:uncharacterized protein B0T15DRAFT_235141 [Chaetomium strumarium]|uniref:Secreted protein n=1 Tax=Chaetomium strumarium TaxID=1170767 RepID=A0AAJ0GQM0_9PEZI|nr:hypothetical protein B0T15DRAFT_235141 [Chaetomium strumarium]
MLSWRCLFWIGWFRIRGRILVDLNNGSTPSPTFASRLAIKLEPTKRSLIMADSSTFSRSLTCFRSHTDQSSVNAQDQANQTGQRCPWPSTASTSSATPAETLPEYIVVHAIV